MNAFLSSLCGGSIVGAGPAGLTAALRLAQQGYQVTIFEAEPVLGGEMILGIPDYRLPKDIIRREIESITNMENVEVKTNTKVGRDVSLDTLREEYDAVLLAVGAMKSRRLDIPGEESEGVVHGVDFLKVLNMGEDVSYVKGKRAAIIGGGDIAIDAARSLIRLGADEVSIVYRRRREDMTALDEEIEAAEEEGVKFMFLLMPIEVISEAGPRAKQRNSRMNGLLCQRMRLEDENKRPLFDSSGRKRPFPIEDEKVVLKVDMLILAIGQEVDPSFIDGSKSEIVVDRGGSITAEERTFDTNEEGVFAIGDAVSGPARIDEAHHGEEEGLKFKLLMNPIRIIGDDEGWVKGMECIRMELGEPDESGRRRPIPVEGSETILDVECVIVAIGNGPNPLVPTTTPGLRTNKRGNIVADEETGLTSKEGVFAGGDIVTGAATVILAMGAGKKAAVAIDEYVREKHLAKKESQLW